MGAPAAVLYLPIAGMIAVPKRSFSDDSSVATAALQVLVGHKRNLRHGKRGVSHQKGGARVRVSRASFKAVFTGLLPVHPARRRGD